MNLCNTETELVELVCRCAALKFNNKCPAFNKQDIEKLKAKDELLSASNVEYILLRYYEERTANFCDPRIRSEFNDGASKQLIHLDSNIVRLTMENRFFRRNGVYFFTKHIKGK